MAFMSLNAGGISLVLMFYKVVWIRKYFEVIFFKLIVMLKKKNPDIFHLLRKSIFKMMTKMIYAFGLVSLLIKKGHKFMMDYPSN